MKKIEELIADLSSLDVVTLTGNLTVKVNDLGTEDGDGDKPIRFSHIMKSLRGNIFKDGAQISALAATHVSIDRDTVNFVRDNLSPEEVAYLDFHNNTVKAAGVARAAMAQGMAQLIIGNKDN